MKAMLVLSTCILLVAILALVAIGYAIKVQDQKLGVAYGCGRAAARNVYYPSKDPIDNEECLWCTEYHKLWDTWPK